MKSMYELRMVATMGMGETWKGTFQRFDDKKKLCYQRFLSIPFLPLLLQLSSNLYTIQYFTIFFLFSKPSLMLPINLKETLKSFEEYHINKKKFLNSYLLIEKRKCL